MKYVQKIKNSITTRIGLTAILLLVLSGAVAGAQYISAAGTWTEPACAAPGCNTDAPLNTGTSAQVKNGTLGVNGIGVFGPASITTAQGTAANLNLTQVGTATWDIKVPANANSLSFGQAGNEYMRIRGDNTNAGNVGIGTINPRAKLEVNGVARMQGNVTVDGANANHGTAGAYGDGSLVFGSGSSANPDTLGSGEAIASARTADSPNQYGLDFYTQFANRMSITQPGNVGVGITNPSGKLSVSMNNQDTINFVTAGDNTLGIQTALDANAYNSTTNTTNPSYQAANRLALQPLSGNVGVGTFNPTQKLTVNGKVGADAYCDQNGQNCLTPGGSVGISGTANYIPKFTSANAIGNSSITDDGTTFTLGSSIINHPGRLHIGYPTGDSGELYVLKQGGLVVGKEWGGSGNITAQGKIYATTPTAADPGNTVITKDYLAANPGGGTGATVPSLQQVATVGDTLSGHNINFNDRNTGITWGGEKVISTGAFDIRLQTSGGQNTLVAQNDGSVYIPRGGITVQGDIITPNNVRASGNVDGADIHVNNILYIGDSTAGSFDSDGNTRMRIGGNVNASGKIRAQNGLCMGTAYSGAGCRTTWWDSSDQRLKENITQLSGALAKIMTLKGVTFDWKDKSRGNSTQIGVIAQDVEKVYPELIGKDDNGMKTVNYNGLIGPLIEAVKEQQKQIEELKNFNTSLLQRIEKLEQK